MKTGKLRSGVALVTVLVLTAVTMIVLGGVLGYVSFSTRATAVYVGEDVCRLAAQSEIEIAKSAINDRFSRSIARGAHIIDTMGSTVLSSFDWFGVGDQTTVTRTIGAMNGKGTALTLAESSVTQGCTVRVRVARILHPANTQWANVTLVAEARRMNPGGTESVAVVEETVRFAQLRSKVFNNAYFVNNYGWFQGSGCTANGDVRANGNMYLDSNCKINGRVFAARNTELGVNGDINNTGKMDNYVTYKSRTYGTNNRTRPLTVDPKSGEINAGGYDAPTTVTTTVLSDRTHANEELETEMPYIGDLSSDNCDYRLWIDELRAADSTMCKLTQGGTTLIDKFYNGTGPSGDPALADKGAIVLEGTQLNPLVINGPVIVQSDVIIKGYVTGQGTIYSGRNIHIVGDIKYKNPPDWNGKSTDGSNNATKDMLGLMAKGNIVLGNCTGTKVNNISTYLTQKPYVQQYACDSTDDLIGYPGTFGGSYIAQEKVTASGMKSQVTANNVPGGWDSQTGLFGKVRETILYKMDGYRRVEVGRTLETKYDRKYYETVCADSVITDKAKSDISQIDAVLYNNHGIFGYLGNCTINGSLVCRNEGIQYKNGLYLNWDIRLFSGSSETVSNEAVGLAKGSDNPPTTVSWRTLPVGLINFDGETEDGGI
jgi:hypothetical protein